MPANTTFRTYSGPFRLDIDYSHPSGIVGTGRLSGTFDALQVNEAGVITGMAVTRGTGTLTITGPGIPTTSETQSLDGSAAVAGRLEDFLVSADWFEFSRARTSYSFSSSDSEIVLRFDTTELLREEIAPNIVVDGKLHYTATLSAAFDEARVVQSQTFQSLFRTNVFNGWSGQDTVDYSFAPNRVIADLQSGTGVNGLGGADIYSSIENLTGSQYGDILAGDAQNNVLFGWGGDDLLIGREGRDVADFFNAREVYTIVDSGRTVHSAEGVDRLEGIERLHFSDKKVAFDLGSGESAGMTVRIIGAAFDTQHMRAELVGQGIALFDAGMSMLQVCELALNTPLFRSLPLSESNFHFVDILYRNIAGNLGIATAAEHEALVTLLDGSGGTMTRAEFLMLAATIPQNEFNIDLIGLQQRGIDFV